MEAKNSGSLSKKTAYTTQYKRVIASERICIKDHFKDGNRGPFDRKQLGGLALSGGGVRSASFVFGVMQALAANKADAVEGQPSILQRLHYLSTVSGGGFAGAALTRLMSHPTRPYDLAKNFPLRNNNGRYKNSDAPSEIAAIRYKASYLDANSGPARLNVIGVVARTVFLTLTIYLIGLATVVGFLHPVFLKPRISISENFGYDSAIVANPLLLIAGGLGLLLVFLWFCYSLLSGVDSRRTLTISSRRKFEDIGGWIAFLALISAIFGMIDYVPRFEELAPKIGLKSTLGALVGLGSFFAVFSRFEGLFGNISDKRWSSTILIWTSGIILVIFMLLAARETALFWADSNTQHDFFHSRHYWIWIVSLAVAFVFFGSVANVNYVGLHRFYRDRLMRTFLTGKDEHFLPTVIDRAELDTFCKNPKGLYHLINANVVLVNSKHPKFRGRGGDSYILSPLYTGSQATGWVCTNAPKSRPISTSNNTTPESGPPDSGNAAKLSTSTSAQ